VDATSDIPKHDYTVPLDKAAVRREGKDVTVLSWLLMAHLSLVAAEQLSALGINGELVDLRSLVPIDYETISHPLKTPVESCSSKKVPRPGGVSAEIAAGIPGAF
jgi:pyruvate dehydrogenase E1 component beta subunit